MHNANAKKLATCYVIDVFFSFIHSSSTKTVAVGNDNINFACDNDFKYNIKYINIVAVTETGLSIQPEFSVQRSYKSCNITRYISHYNRYVEHKIPKFDSHRVRLNVPSIRNNFLIYFSSVFFAHRFSHRKHEEILTKRSHCQYKWLHKSAQSFDCHQSIRIGWHFAGAIECIECSDAIEFEQKHFGRHKWFGVDQDNRHLKRPANYQQHHQQQQQSLQ